MSSSATRRTRALLRGSRPAAAPRAHRSRGCRGCLPRRTRCRRRPRRSRPGGTRRARSRRAPGRSATGRGRRSREAAVGERRSAAAACAAQSGENGSTPASCRPACSSGRSGSRARARSRRRAAAGSNSGSSHTAHSSRGARAASARRWRDRRRRRCRHRRRRRRRARACAPSASTQPLTIWMRCRSVPGALGGAGILERQHREARARRAAHGADLAAHRRAGGVGALDEVGRAAGDAVERRRRRSAPPAACRWWRRSRAGAARRRWRRASSPPPTRRRGRRGWCRMLLADLRARASRRRCPGRPPSRAPRCCRRCALCVSVLPMKPKRNGFTPSVCSSARPSFSALRTRLRRGYSSIGGGRSPGPSCATGQLLEGAQLVLGADADAGEAIEAALRVALALVDLDQRLAVLAPLRLGRVGRIDELLAAAQVRVVRDDHRVAAGAGARGSRSRSPTRGPAARRRDAVSSWLAANGGTCSLRKMTLRCRWRPIGLAVCS